MKTAATACPFRLPNWPLASSADPVRDLADILWDMPAGEVMDVCEHAGERALADEVNRVLERVATVLLERSHAWYRAAA